MTSTTTEPAGSSNTNSLHRGQLGTGHFMLTLCQLAAPVTIRPPQSPHLKPFTFFTSCARQSDGSERLYLHMGYFETLADAERWVDAIRGRYPEAIATIAPTAFLRTPQPEAVASQHADSPLAVSGGSDPAPARDQSLSDTQVLKVLESRGTSPAQGGVDGQGCDQIGLLRPEDTSTRQALKEAVIQGAAVPFAVQLQWSAEPIDPSRVPALAVFKGYTLYGVESRREGRSRYFLRLGFFEDAVSAKQVAAQLRSNFASAAVVPVGEEEVARAREASIGDSSIPFLVQQRVNPAPDANGTPRSATETKPFVPRRIPRGAETLMQTLKKLAERELWTDPESLSESGVRHLKVEVQKHTTGRS
jgi:hypothetical protein